MLVDKSKSIKSRSRDFDRNKNFQLESLYLHELGSRVEAWKRYEDGIARQHQNWPPPADGKVYNAREQAVYGVNSNDFKHASWFHRRMYRNILSKATQRLPAACYSILDAHSPSKETQLEKEVVQLRARLEKLKSCSSEHDGRPWCEQHSEPMYPVKPAIRYLLYDGTSRELEGRVAYLSRRKVDAPDEKYCEPLCTSWDVTWNLKSFLQHTRKPDTVCTEEMF